MATTGSWINGGTSSPITRTNIWGNQSYTLSQNECDSSIGVWSLLEVSKKYPFQKSELELKDFNKKVKLIYFIFIFIG